MFVVGEWILLRVSPIKGMMRFEFKGKISMGSLDLLRSFNEL